MSQVNVDDSGLLTDLQLLAALIGVGIPLRRATKSLVSGASRDETREVFSRIAERVEEGCTLSRGLSESEGSEFWKNDLLVAIVRAGEVGGMFKESLQVFADYTERKLSVKHDGANSLWLFSKLMYIGVPILQTLTLLGAEFPRLGVHFANCASVVREGGTVAEGLSRKFRPPVIELIRIGEEFANLDLMLMIASELELLLDRH